MAVQLDHTIVASRDKHASAAFLARILGLGPPEEAGHFVTVEVANGVSLDFDDARSIAPQHYAFLVGNDEFDP
ncbi:MAG: VOC family protein, partial [Acidimicrobiales bacterium]|nr:VOC family protein [Acidimicrobiales bacterium]